MTDHTSPRFGGPLYGFRKDTGAMSRLREGLDVEVIICSNCGAAEARTDPLGKKGFEG
jgi:hypothetical protein